MKEQLWYASLGITFLLAMTWCGLKGYVIPSLVFDFFAGLMAALLIFKRDNI